MTSVESRGGDVNTRRVLELKFASWGVQGIDVGLVAHPSPPLLLLSDTLGYAMDLG